MSAHSLFRRSALPRSITAPRLFGHRRITTSKSRLSETTRTKKTTRNGIVPDPEVTNAATDASNEVSDSGLTNAPTSTAIAVIDQDRPILEELSLQMSAESKRLRGRFRKYIADSEHRSRERQNVSIIMNMLVATISFLWIDSRLKQLESKLKPTNPSAKAPIQEKEDRPTTLLPEVQWQRTQSTLSRWFWASDQVLDAQNALAAERQCHRLWLERSRQEWKAFLMRQEDLINKIGKVALSKLADGAMERHREEQAEKSQADMDQDYMGMLSE